MTNIEISERIESALAQITDIADASWVSVGLHAAFTAYSEEHERVATSHMVAESEITALSTAVAQREVAASALHAIEQGRVLTCSQLRDYFIMQASFHVPDNGGIHGYISQQKTKYAIDMLGRLLAVTPR